MSPPRIVLILLAAIVALVAAAPALAHQGPPEGACVSVNAEGRDVTIEIAGPADVEAWIKIGDDDWARTGATFDGVFIPGGYRWVADSAVVTATLPPGDVEFRLGVWSTAGLDESCYVALPEGAAPLPPPPAPPPPPEAEAPRQVIPAVAPPLRPRPARIRIRKTGPKKVRAGDRALYRIRVTNTTNRRVRFTLIDRLPADVVLRTRRKGWTIRGRGIRVPMVLKARQTRTLKVPVRVLASARGRRCNVAVIRGREIVNRRVQTCARVTRRIGRVLPAVTG